MIRADLQSEPPEFDEAVRQPGAKVLAGNAVDLPSLWTRCLPDLQAAYQGICAYLGVLIGDGTGAPTVDHFLPKSSHRSLAYEWANYRLACSRMNSRKNAYQDVLDPFAIEDGWFNLNLSNMAIYPNPSLDTKIKADVQGTIDRLKLDDRICRRARLQYYDAYANRGISFEYLEKWSPFVARELRRQGAAR